MASIETPTELFLSLRHYPRGFDLRLSRGLTATYMNGSRCCCSGTIQR